MGGTTASTKERARSGTRGRQRSSSRPVEVIEARIQRPLLRPGTVPREDLVHRLCRTGSGAVLVTAPAGYGKTTLLSEWAEHDPRPFAWVSVDPAMVDPVVFLTHVAVALDRIEPVSPAVFDAILSPGASDPTRIARRLGAAIRLRAAPFVLALDDLDRAADPLCVDAVTTLIDHLPSGSVLAIAARTLPGVNVARLRAEGRLHEIGADDLSLDADQARQLLLAAGQRVTKATARELADATEGWPVGLYLASLAMRAPGRSREVALSFTGHDRYLTDYVRSEVLSTLSTERQRFLVRTSILERLSGPLCDAVLGRTGSARTLESLERENLLLVPLDRERAWYRYHHLFRDVLLDELQRREPDRIPELHGRAAAWFRDADSTEEAIEHAYLAGDVDGAAQLLQRMALASYQRGRLPMLRDWLQRIGEEGVARNVGLAILAAYVGGLGGDPASADRWADVVDRSTLDGPSYYGTASLRSSVAIMRTILARDGAVEMLREAEIAVREEPDASPFRAGALGFRGLATLLSGDLDAADDRFSEAADVGVRSGAFPGASLALAERSLIAMGRGDRSAAAEFARQARDLVREGNLEDHITTGIVFAASARVALREGDTDGARAEIAAAQRLRPLMTYGFPSVSVQTRLELVRVHVGLSDIAGARTLLAEVGDILTHRPDLGILTQQAQELRRHVGSVRSTQMPGPSTLTGAELRLLTYLPTHLSFREIGSRLYVSQNTIKTQAISIYRKLGVSARSEAVETARTVGLLDP